MKDSFRPKIFRLKARTALRGKWGMSALIFFVYFVIAILVQLLVSVIPFGSIAASILFSSVIGWGVYFLFLDVSNGDDAKLDGMFEPFKNYGRYVGGTALTFLYTFLWMLLLIVPGIIKSYSYSQTPLLMRENPELGAEQAIQLSMKMMKGHKWELFLLDLSFIGWALLCIPTLFIGYYWLGPYIITARAEFYKELKKEWESRQELTEASA